MEQDKNSKLGAGIITMSVISLVCGVLGIISMIFMSYVGNKFGSELGPEFEQMATDPIIMIIPIIFSILSMVAIILILMKKSFGIYLYITVIVVGFVFNAIMTPEQLVVSLIGLLYPALMLFFIYKKRHLFGFKNPSIESQEQQGL